MPITDTPLRYPGGKTQLTPFVHDLLRENDLLQSVYCEPFAGGAGIACRLLLNGNIAEAWINDIDPAIYAFWYSILNYTDQFCEHIQTITVDISEWHLQRSIYLNERENLFNLGFSTLFLNRTNRSGILKGGVIGGISQSGKYSIDCRFGKEELIRKIRRIALYKNQITLTQVDAQEYIASNLKTLPKHSLVNIDPPYYRAGPDLYTNSYQHGDHVALSVAVKDMKHHWMMTYDEAPEIIAMYNGLRQFRKNLTYYAQVKRSAAELLVISDDLILPKFSVNLQAKTA